MRFILERVLDPESEPVTRAELKTHLRAYSDDTSEDDLFDSLIVGAREWVEDFTGRALMDQQWRLTILQSGELFESARLVDGRYIYTEGRFIWASAVGEIMLRKSPALAITSFVTLDSDGAETTVDAATYELREADSKWPRVVPKTGALWTAANLRIVFRAGFADTTGSPQETAAEVPERFKMAMKLHAEAYYDKDPVMMDKLLAAATALIRAERAEVGFA